MEIPNYPPEWKKLRLELKDDTPPKTIKKQDEVKVSSIRPVSILKNPNEKIEDFEKNHKKLSFCNCM